MLCEKIPFGSDWISKITYFAIVLKIADITADTIMVIIAFW